MTDTDNVIILGAGFSYDAGIPMLSNFIERMWEYSVRGKANDQKLDVVDSKILAEALDIRKEMDGYHGRVAFDDRNIEDILSMLVFNLIGGGISDRNKLNAFINAISKTIELACNVKHPGVRSRNNPSVQAINEGAEVYRKFWQALIHWYQSSGKFPTIITFNYDLVLERSLLQVLNNKFYNNRTKHLPFDYLSLNYHYKLFPQQFYKVNYISYGRLSQQSSGTSIEHSFDDNMRNIAEIEIIKLHGSLNYPKMKSKEQGSDYPSIASVIDKPYILPPVSNKQSTTVGNQSWKTALQRLQVAKNVVFVGYSMPMTDMYMQFFLKAALGPNQELNKVYVFDPVLWNETESAQDMKSRFEKCFSEQLRSRIIFDPPFVREADSKNAGTTEHFASVLEREPSKILF